MNKDTTMLKTFLQKLALDIVPTPHPLLGSKKVNTQRDFVLCVLDSTFFYVSTKCRACVVCFGG
jgi:hypothetical protein